MVELKKAVLAVKASDDKRHLLPEAAAMLTPRATLDLDVRVMPSPDKAEAVLRALRHFGAPVQDLTLNDLQTDGRVVRPPSNSLISLSNPLTRPMFTQILIA